LQAAPEGAAQSAAAGSLGDIPRAVLSHGPAAAQPDLPEVLLKPTHDAWQPT
jgi:hypothetical protein